jgi:hypothetical protein
MARNTENDIPNVNLQNDHLPDFSQSGQLRTNNMIGARKELERATPKINTLRMSNYTVRMNQTDKI